MSIVRNTGGSEKVTIDGKKVKRRKNLVTTQSYKEISTLPFPQSNYQVGVLRPFIKNDILNILTYTYDSNRQYNNSFTYNKDIDAWENKKSIPFTIGNISSVGNHKNNIYAVATDTNNIAYNIYKLLDTESWSKLKTAPADAVLRAAGVGENHIYILVPVYPGNTTHNLYEYNADDNSWTMLQDFPILKDYSGSQTTSFLKDAWHLIGGFDSVDTGKYKKIHYKFVDGAWTKLSDLPFYNYAAPITEMIDKLYITGVYHDINMQKEKYTYIYDDDSWTLVDSPLLESLNIIYKNEKLYQLGVFSKGSTMCVEISKAYKEG